MAAIACKLGAIDEDLADLLCVSLATIKNWKKEHPDEFLAPIKEAKNERDEAIAESLYTKALGGNKVIEKKVTVNADGTKVSTITEREAQPDTTAQIFWLKNRQPDKWRDVRDQRHSGSIGATFADGMKKVSDAIESNPDLEKQLEDKISD